MSRRALILVEGQTEERVVKDLIAPILAKKQLFITPTIVKTKVVPGGSDFKGGLISYQNFRTDLQKLLRGSGGALVTTMIDFYGLPDDFPGMHDLPQKTDNMLELHIAQATHVEEAIALKFDSPQNFLPFVALHELEAWLFSSDDVAPGFLQFDADCREQFARICREHDTPQKINTDILTAPSKRLLQIFPRYRKTLHGPAILSRIGIPAIRAKCPHFDEWFTQLEKYAEG